MYDIPLCESVEFQHSPFHDELDRRPAKSTDETSRCSPSRIRSSAASKSPSSYVVARWLAFALLYFTRDATNIYTITIDLDTEFTRWFNEGQKKWDFRSKRKFRAKRNYISIRLIH